MKLLLVEDEDELSFIIAKGLKKCGYVVDVAFDGEEALYYYEVNEYDLIILDLNIPKIDGLDVLRQIRKTDKTMKVIILSARSDIEDRVLGLDTGANDYLIKPFDFIELEARIRTLLRMMFIQQDRVLQCGGLVVDTKTKQAALHDNRLSLTKKEYSILEYMILHKEQILSSESIVEHVWNSEADLFSNSVKYHLHSIKKKLNDIDGSRQYIVNIRGMGYKLTEENDELVE